MAVLTLPRLRLTHFFFWALIFSSLLLITRLGNLGLEVIDWNESSYIIVASHMKAGYLLYLDLFDLKPPGIYLALAGAMTLFGEHLLTVRFFGTICLLVAALSCYGIAVRRNSSLAAGVSTSVFLVLTGASDFQPTLTEHLVIALMLPACWLLVARRNQLWSAFTIGLLLSLATLTRTNIAIVVLALGGFYAWQLWQPSKGTPRLALLYYGAGGLVPLLTVLCYYAYADALDEFFLSNVLAPLSYSSQGSSPASLLSYIRIWKGFIGQFSPIFLPATVYLGLTLYVAQQRRRILSGDEGLLLFVLAATFLSVLVIGASAGHHLLQIIPLLAAFATYGLQGPLRYIAYVCACLTIAGGIALLGPNSAAIARDWPQHEARYNLQRIAELILADKETVEGFVYAPTYHLVHWYLGPGSLPSRVVHPSDLSKEAITGPLVEHGYLSGSELKRIWSSRLSYVVLVGPGRPWYFSEDEYEAFKVILARDFELWQRIGYIDAFRRKN